MHRCDVLRREGLNKQKYSSVLGIGRSQMISEGSIEALSHSGYLKYMQGQKRNSKPSVILEPQQIPSSSSGAWKAPRPQATGDDVQAVRDLP